MTDSIIFGVLACIVFVCLIYIYRQHQQQSRIEQRLIVNNTDTALLQERFDQVSRDNAQQQSQLATTTDEFQTTRTELTALKQDVEHKNSMIKMLQQGNTNLEQQLEQLRQHDNNLKNNLTKLQTQYEQEQKNSLEKLALLEEAKIKLAQEFKLLANQIFEDKQHKMTQSSAAALDNIIKPMQKDILEFRTRIEQVHKEDIEARGSLAHHLNDLKTLNQQMSHDALNLTLALKGDSKAQGNWGEMILEKLLESSGLREGYEFEREKSFTNDEGKRHRPDVIINMPGDKQVIIDAKVSLTDYERAISSQEDAEKQQHIRAHVRSMQQHIQTLASKRYDHLDGVHSPDYVLMFMPIEGAYLMAIEADSSIFENAFDKRIAVVTPSTLYATLKLIEQLWRYERQSENVAKLINRAGMLHDKVVDFMKSFEDVGQRLGQAQVSYEKAFGQIKTGRGNVISQIKILGNLSGKAKKEIPVHLFEDQQDEIDHQPLVLDEKQGDKT